MIICKSETQDAQLAVTESREDRFYLLSSLNIHSPFNILCCFAYNMIVSFYITINK